MIGGYGAWGEAHGTAEYVFLKRSGRRWEVELVRLVLGHGSAVLAGKLVEYRRPIQFRSGVGSLH